MTNSVSKAAKERFPSQIKFIVGSEAAERFSYYGMRNILFMFMTGHLLMSSSQAKEIYHLFIGAAYFLPLLGGYLSDRFFGKYRTIFWLSLVYCAGHLVLALFETRTGLYWGLALVALGAGGIKPCVSAFVGDQFTTKNQHLVTRVFDLFYFSINFGSVFASVLIPQLLKSYGPSIAFAVPGLFMGLATMIFVAGRKQYVEIPPTGKTNKPSFLAIVFAGLLNLSHRKAGRAFFSGATQKYGAEDVENAEAVWGVVKVFATVTVFWAMFDQQGGSWVDQARHMNQNAFGLTIDPSQMQAANPAMVMLLIPFFTYLVYPMVERMGIKVTPLRKMATGVVLAGFSFIAMGVLQNILDSGRQLSILWQLIPYFILTASEVMVSITGLEFAYTQAPRAVKSTVMSFWLLTISVGNFLAAYIAHINVFKGAMEFHFYGILALALSVVFIYTASRYQVRNYMGGAKPT